jgi:putative ABC transport system permease protein
MGSDLLHYYLQLGALNLRNGRIVTMLMVIAIGLGIGASMTMITVIHAMTRDPIPTRSQELFYPHIDPSPPGWEEGSDAGADFTWVDANNLLQAHKADRQAAAAGGRVLVTPPAGRNPFYARGHYVSAEFFAMFDAPFQDGGDWTSQQDTDRARVVVLNGELYRKLFGDSNGIGKTVRLNDTDLTVVGVLDDWHPQPLFYGGFSGDYAFGQEDQFFAPLTTALAQKFRVAGGMSCWGEDSDIRMGDHCSWLQFWVQLKGSERQAAYLRFLNDYWRDQRQHGRLQRSPDARLYGLLERMKQLKLVPDDLRQQLWLAQLFLCVCILNSVGLLLAKFLQMSGQISVRRALGAAKRDILFQLMTEAAIVGLLGGVLGCIFSALGLWLVRGRPDHYAKLAQFDMQTLLATFAFAVIASLLAAALPAWRACRVPPALELKLQ